MRHSQALIRGRMCRYRSACRPRQVGANSESIKVRVPVAGRAVLRRGKQSVKTVLARYAQSQHRADTPITDYRQACRYWCVQLMSKLVRIDDHRLTNKLHVPVLQLQGSTKQKKAQDGKSKSDTSIKSKPAKQVSPRNRNDRPKSESAAAKSKSDVSKKGDHGSKQRTDSPRHKLDAKPRKEEGKGSPMTSSKSSAKKERRRSADDRKLLVGGTARKSLQSPTAPPLPAVVTSWQWEGLPESKINQFMPVRQTLLGPTFIP